MRLFTITCLLFAAHTVSIARPDSLRYRNLVFEGGGVRGIAYAGALNVLEQRGILASVERVGGTSVGAITALLLAVGYNTGEIRSLLSDLKIQQFNDGRWFFLGGFHRLNRRYGWYRGDRFERWVETVIVRKMNQPDLTFADLHQRHLADASVKDLYVTGTNLTTQKIVVFSHEQTPDMPLKTAIRISMSVPMYFGAVLLDDQNQVVTKPKKGQDYQVMVDGGILANYPLNLFDTDNKPNLETLGLKLVRPAQADYARIADGPAPYPIHNIKQYVGALYTFVLDGFNNRQSGLSERERTLYISTEGISPRVRHVPRKQVQRLYESGERGAMHFLR
ncbi:patatin-like phospholipase family protein [Spirosoma rhododendri]|uniref:Patatin-like phospholipase family protein n=1 Tax=Spirosoma rhododendri TaxID=2728024 RepID=A0A7L5DRG9_9BACT|nr:patatin-like phospholipase family protein [Spirosoma rhododendri]QJD81016.1 patatin-like phospholipase family protein [Spirosoma rhododendri]